MYEHNILFIGLDTHKVSTEVAHVEDQRGAKPIISKAISIQIPTGDPAFCL